MATRTHWLTTGLLLTFGCTSSGTNGADSGGESTGPKGATATSAASIGDSGGQTSHGEDSGVAATSGTTDTAGSTTDSPPRFDLGVTPDIGRQAAGCRGIDFLFVIDNSGSMADEQQNLINSFPGFINTIQATVADAAQDFHVMVTDSDAGEYCVAFCSMLPTNCSMTSCDQWVPAATCDTVLGAGRTFDQHHQDCGLASGQRYITSMTSDVSSSFSCLASAGILGAGSETIAASMIQAVDPALLGSGGCNEGFLRDDAILVVTFITDEEEQASPGAPTDWYQALLAAKGGDPNAIVMLGLFGDTDQPNAICAPQDPSQMTGAEAAPRLREFVDLFGAQGSWGSVCVPDYSPFLAAAVDLVDTTCDQFTPAG